MTDIFERIKNFCVEGKVNWTAHITMRLLQRKISLDDVKETILSGEIIETYPEDYPHPSYLICGKDLQEKFLHVVCGVSDENLWLITDYDLRLKNGLKILKFGRRDNFEMFYVQRRH